MLQWRPRRSAVAPAAVPAFELRAFDLRPAGPAFSLLRVETVGAEVPPVLLVDDGARVHRLEPLPTDQEGRFGYGIPSKLLSVGRAAMALELSDRVRLDIPVPRGV
jgi:hypothetical protein